MYNIFDFLRKKNKVNDNNDVFIPVIDFEKYKKTEKKITYEKIISSKSTRIVKEILFNGKDNQIKKFNAPKDHIIIVPNLQLNIKKNDSILNYNIIYENSKIIYNLKENNNNPSNNSSLSIGIPDIINLSANYKTDNNNENIHNEYLYTNINQIELCYEGLNNKSYLKGYFEYYIIPKEEALEIYNSN